jgi:asparagine synthase (glutamine-hydrolysing)
LGHALLKLPGNPPHERQPCTLDGKVWIVADARLDGRAELIATLKRADRGISSDTTDAELLLHAYHAWGESCVERLIGDLAFALWDERRDMLFCARDHFGVVPLYYAEVDGGLIVSNALDCVRLHPRVSNRLNEAAIGDYLLFGCNQDRRTTFFSEVQRLPPAHVMTWSDGRMRTSRYWKLHGVRPERIEPAEVVEEFVRIFRTSVEDRLNPGPIAILMSGGLDSTTIAALALDATRRGSGSIITGHVSGFSNLIPDEEPHHAITVAEALGVPIRNYDGDAYLLEREGRRAWLAPPEPRGSLHVTPMREILEGVAAEGGRVFLSGEGGDLVLKPDRRWRLRRWLRGWSRRLRGSTRGVLDPPFERWWLDPEFVDQMALADRWRSVMKRVRQTSKRRAVSEDAVSEVLLSSRHAEFTGLPLVFRHPFSDVRLLSFLQSIPPRPWLVKKHIVREAMREVLPEAILERPKTPLAGHFHQPLAIVQRDPWLEELARTPELAAYVAPEPLIDAIRQPETVTKGYVQRVILPLGLAFWLRERASRPRLPVLIGEGEEVQQLF